MLTVCEPRPTSNRDREPAIELNTMSPFGPTAGAPSAPSSAASKRSTFFSSSAYTPGSPRRSDTNARSPALVHEGLNSFDGADVICWTAPLASERTHTS